MKQQDKSTVTKFVAVTAHALPGDRESYLEAGFTGYLSKPVRVEELRRVLAEQLGIEDD
jgi:CheY-like chemotaxis protein